MRPIYLLLLVLAVCLLFVSCKKDGTNNNSVTGPDLTQEDFHTNYDYVIYFGAALDDSKSTYYFAEVWVKNNTSNIALQVNGTTLAWDDMDEEDGSYWYWYDDINTSYGSNISYKLTVGKAVYQGTVKMPSNLTVNFPSSFDPNSNFNINWSISPNPWCFYLSYYFEGNNDQEVEGVKQLSGSTRSYTIPKSVWQSIDVVYVDTGVGARGTGRMKQRPSR